ncbi:hypothetical protein AB0O28_15940 [Microbispora sp. NPDC088329]|uniref:hypothetical protein n=1 Tax=Microbispora sp. NPDC088329 TaxID=3154869 RepID=UPI003412C565
MTTRTRGRTAGARDLTRLADRACRLVEALGGRFSRETGIDVDRGDREVERWLLAATLFGTRISSGIAVRTYRAMAEAGVRTLSDAEGRTWEELVEILDRGGYARYDYRTATRLLRLAEAVGGGVGALRGADLDETRAALGALPGWGPVTVALFLRELRGVWPGVDPPPDDRAVEAGRHAGLLGGEHHPLRRLREIAGDAGLDVRDLETALVRLWLAHHRGFPPLSGRRPLRGGDGGGVRCGRRRGTR